MRPALLALVCALGCATSGETWHQVKTPNFKLRAQLDAGAAVAAADALEDARDALISAGWPSLDFDNLEPTEVYVLPTRADLQAYFGAGVAGLFWHGAPGTVVLGGSPGSWETRRDLHAPATSVLRHELAHQLASVIYRRQPLWFAEGLAQFLETVSYNDDHTAVVLGAVNPDALASYREHRSITVRQTLDWGRRDAGPPGGERRGLYGTSWLLVHWLYNTHADGFRRFQTELARGTNPWRAWDIAFPGFDDSEADRQLYAYSKHGTFTLTTLPVHRRPRGFAAQLLPGAEAHFSRAVVASFASDYNRPRREALAAESGAELTAARELDPGNVGALWWSFHGDPLDFGTRAQRAVTAHPEDPRAHILLSRAAPDARAYGPLGEAPLRKAVELDPQNATALNDLAWLLLKNGKTPAALGYALRAAKRVPWDANTLDTLARALFLSGSCEKALAIQQQVTDTSVILEPGSGQLAERQLHLAEYIVKCGPRDKPPAAH